jgi:hypothetical protein
MIGCPEMQVNDRTIIAIDISGISGELLRIINDGTHMSEVKPISA